MIASIKEELDSVADAIVQSKAKPTGVTTGMCAISLTEDNIARVFAREYSGKLLFDHTSGRWLVWDGARWKPETTELVYHFARELTRGLNIDGRAKWAKASVFGAVEKIARTDRAFARTLTEFDVDPYLLGTPGGIVDLRTGALLPADPARMITHITSVTPQAGEPRQWLKFLAEATGGDVELIRSLKRLCGYALTGVTTEHTLVFVHGPGGNGKGVFINVVSRIMGDYSQTADMKAFTASRNDRHPTELAALRGARLVTACETEQNAEWAESRVKQLTGGDVVRARFMRCDEFEYRPQFKLVIIGNHRPRLRDIGEAMRRRLRIVPFEFKPEVINPHLEGELVAAEGGHILNWMIEGCVEWREGGLPMPLAVQVATDDYFESQDTMSEWLETECELERRFSEESGLLFKSWSDFCHKSGDDAGTQVGFAEALKQRGLTKKRSTGGRRRWFGVRLKPQASNGEWWHE